MKWQIGKAQPFEVELAEEAFNRHAQLAESAPHRWGEVEEAELGRLADELRRLYREYDVPEFDRIQL